MPTHLNELANLSISDGDLHPGKVGVEPPLQGGHQLDTRELARVDGFDSLGHVGGDRLLAEDMLAVFGAGLDLWLRCQGKYEQQDRRGRGWVDGTGGTDALFHRAEQKRIYIMGQLLGVNTCFVVHEMVGTTPKLG